MAGLAVLIAAGCAQNELGRYSGFYEPVIRNPKRVRNAIVKSENYWIQKDVAPEEEFPGPTPDDLKSSEKDYILGPGDLIDISVFELMSPGVPYATRLRISQTGQITFPYIGSVKCARLTTRGLEEKLGDLLSPDYLANPQISVFVSEFRNLNVSVMNGVARPGLYPMAKQDMTLLELVAMSGGVMQLVEDYGYVVRKYALEEADLLGLEGAAPPPEGETPAPGPPAAPPTEPKPGEPAAPAKAAPAAEPKKEGAAAPAAPSAEAAQAARQILEKMAAGELPPVGRIEAAEAAAQKPPAGDAQAAPAPNAGASEPKPPAAAKAPPPPPAEAVPPVAQATASKDEKELGRWIWSDGKWVEVKDKSAPEGKPALPADRQAGVAAQPPEGQPPVERPAVAAKPAEGPQPPEAAQPPEGVPAEVAAGKLEEKLRRLGVIQGAGQLRRIIRFDVRALQAGDPTQNIVLRDGDMVTIPSPSMGDFYLAGEVARPGVYSLTGRKITLLQAVAAAGGLTAVAVPWRTEVVRRISETEEDIIYVDISQVARGEVPDFYVQPEDLIRVGTDQGAVFNAVNRNAYRATYGWGSVYDMNFGDFYPWSVGRYPIVGGLGVLGR
jgi:protein involved in polysaccharide export with SLBB domain